MSSIKDDLWISLFNDMLSFNFSFSQEAIPFKFDSGMLRITTDEIASFFIDNR